MSLGEVRWYWNTTFVLLYVIESLTLIIGYPVFLNALVGCGLYYNKVNRVTIETIWIGRCWLVQSNLDYPDLDYPDFSIIRTFSLVPFFSWILISFDLKSFQR